MKKNNHPFIVLIAGMPRSGSTWAFNAARLILNIQYKQVHAVWCDDFIHTDQSEAQLIKIHNPSEGNIFKPDKIITTYRPFSECIASKIRMGWLQNTPEAKIKAEEQQRQLYEYWQSKSDYEVQYCRLLSEPTIEISGIANALGISLEKIQILHIIAELSNLSPPKSGPYDPVTLLHPNHRKL